ncbi:unnamed protein product, partial [Symbiodinium sp. CCMP2456]
MTTWPWRLLFFLVIGCSGELCLLQGIPSSQRAYVLNGAAENVAIKLMVFNWRAAELLSTIAKLLIEEVLGYHAVFDDTRPIANIEVVQGLAGCSDIDCNETQKDKHVALDVWLGSAGADVELFMQRHPATAPEDLGSIGYAGEEALCITGKLLDEAYEVSGFSLDFYRSYNMSHYRAAQHFDQLSDLPAQDLFQCDEAGVIWTDPSYMADYARWSGDLAGLVEVGGGYRAYCPDGRFWIAPACRHNTSECIPIISSQWGWMVDAFMAWSTAYGLPTAIAIARDIPEWVASFQNFRILAYWYRPDASLAPWSPRPIKFPRHRASEWAEGNKRTEGLGTYIGKLVSRGLSSQASKVHKLIQKMQMELEEMEALLLEAESDGIQKVACEWAKANQQRWQQWLPIETSCMPGFGLADAQGSLVTSRSLASSCKVCPAGTFSSLMVDNLGQTFSCESCAPGTYQGQAGETLCLGCEPGTVAAASGLVGCVHCDVGSFANASRMLECTPCGSGPWTTGRISQLFGDETWIDVEGASSEDLCHCRQGFFLHNGQCTKCTEGGLCSAGEIRIVPGFFSSAEKPDSIFTCYGDTDRCPGGSPGTCANGRDVQSIACIACLPGLHAHGAECVPCGNEDYLLFLFAACLVLVVSGGLHFQLLRWDCQSNRKQFTGVLIPSLYATQLVSCLQILVLLQKIDVSWGDPFVGLLEAVSFLSLEHIVRFFNAVSCATPSSPALHFLIQTIVLPASLMLGPVVVHMVRNVCLPKWMPRHSSQWQVLFQSIGTVSVLFFIVLCSAVVQPFQCHGHPNGLYTMRSSIGVLCNLTDDHLQLCIMGGLLALLPAGFVALCAWLILVEYPKRLRSTDLSFMRMSSFLISRFRPGCESFSIFLLVRNLLFVMAPVLPTPDSSLLLIYVLLIVHIIVLALLKPWRSVNASYTDILASSGLLVILFHASLLVTGANEAASMILCSLLLICLLVCLSGVAFSALAQHIFTRFAKKYQFFLCHHKQVTGCLARLLKMELQRRGSEVFLDSDDLTNLTLLLPMVAQHVNTLVVVASANVVTRKWCLAEIVTAYMHKVHTVILALSDYGPPSDKFIKVFESNANDLSELAVHGFGVSDIADSLRWVRTLQTLSIPQPRNLLCNLGEIVDQLLGTTEQSMVSEAGSDCKILANQDDIEAVATAHVLRHLLAPHILHLFSILPVVLDETDDVRLSTSRLTMSRPDQAVSTMLLMVCTRECLTSPCMVKWLLQANHVASSCCVLPVLGDEEFLVPTSSAAFQRLGEHPDLKEHANVSRYLKVLGAIFMQIAVHFWPKSYSESALGLKAEQVAQRLQGEQSATLSSLLDMSWFTSQKSVLLETVEELSPVAASSDQEEANRLEEAAEALEAE